MRKIFFAFTVLSVLFLFGCTADKTNTSDGQISNNAPTEAASTQVPVEQPNPEQPADQQSNTAFKTVEDTELSAVYSNSKYNFGISFPKDWSIAEEPPAGDGVVFYADDINDIRVYGGYSLGFENELVENAKKSGAEVSDLINNTGQKGTLIIDRKENKVLFHYLIIGSERQCQFYAFVSEDFYTNSKDLLLDIAKSMELYDDIPDSD